MRAYAFPALCPVCGTQVLTPVDAVENHRACMQLAARCMEWCNAVRSMADSWPGARPVTPDRTTAGRT